MPTTDFPDDGEISSFAGFTENEQNNLIKGIEVENFLSQRKVNPGFQELQGAVDEGVYKKFYDEIESLYPENSADRLRFLYLVSILRKFNPSRFEGNASLMGAMDRWSPLDFNEIKKVKKSSNELLELGLQIKDAFGYLDDSFFSEEDWEKIVDYLIRLSSVESTGGPDSNRATMMFLRQYYSAMQIGPYKAEKFPSPRRHIDKLWNFYSVAPGDSAVLSQRKQEIMEFSEILSALAEVDRVVWKGENLEPNDFAVSQGLCDKWMEHLKVSIGSKNIRYDDVLAFLNLANKGKFARVRNK